MITKTFLPIQDAAYRARATHTRRVRDGLCKDCGAKRNRYPTRCDKCQGKVSKKSAARKVKSRRTRGERLEAGTNG